jgi:hypothetical protein
MKLNRLRIAARVLPFLIFAGSACAQSAPPGPQAPVTTASVAPIAPAAPVPKEQLGQMLAPIALYPDELVTNILMASTYSSQVVEAAAWMNDPNNAGLKGDALADALRPLPWDPSVKFLVPFPQVIRQLNDHADWMQDLGNAFTVQQAAVMSEVQHLREMAMSCGKLQSTAQLSVARHHSTIAITPADPQVVHVPVYDPTVVYGVWPYRVYPPRYYPWPSGLVLGGVGVGLNVGIGYSVGFGAVGPYWGWSRPDWRRGVVSVDFGRVGRFGNYDRAFLDTRFAGGHWHNGAYLARHGRYGVMSQSSTLNGHAGRGEWHEGGGKHNAGHWDNGWHGNNPKSGKHGGGDHGHDGDHGHGKGHGGGHGDHGH